MVDTWDHIDDLGWRRLRWGAGFLLVAGLFTGAAWFVVHWAPPIAPPPAPPPAAVMIDLAPMPAATVTPPTEAPPGPQETLSEPPPEPAPVAPPPLPTTPPAPAPEVAIPLPPPLPPRPPVQRRVHERGHRPPTPHPDTTRPAPATTAPPEVQAPAAPAPASAAPAPATSQPPADAVPTWQGELLGRLERYKRYPSDAQYRHEQGVAYLRFSMDRDGRVISASIVKSSGYADLDQETLALIQRAQPLPKPPPEIAGDPITLTVPVQFFLRGDN